MIKVKIDVGDLMELLDQRENGELYPKVREGDTVKSVRMVGYTEVEFTIGVEDIKE